MAEAQETVAKEQPKTGQKLVVMAVLVGLLIGLAASGWFFYFRASAQETEEPEKEPEVTAFMHLENFLVNLADTDGRHYLRVGIDLGLEGSPEEGGEGPSPLQTALIRDSILSVLTTWDSGPLLTAEGKGKLKEELTHTLQERLPDLGVREVYFNEFLVQR